MVTLYLIAAIAAQTSASPRPDTKRCPDGSTILMSQTCVEFPDHRYLQNHGPETELRTVQWWCRGDTRPSMAQVQIRQHQGRDKGGLADGPQTTVALVALTVKGQRPDQSMLRMMRERLASLSNIGALSGRCLFRRSRGTQSVLTMQGFEAGRRDPRNLEFELE